MKIFVISFVFFLIATSSKIRWSGRVVSIYYSCQKSAFKISTKLEIMKKKYVFLQLWVLSTDPLNTHLSIIFISKSLKFSKKYFKNEKRTVAACSLGCTVELDNPRWLGLVVPLILPKTQITQKKERKNWTVKTF